MKQWMEKIGQWKKEQILIVLLTGILLLVIALPTEETGSSLQRSGSQDNSVGKEQENAAAVDGDRSYEEALEERLKQVLSTVDGVGKVEVMLTLESDGRRIVEKDVEQEGEKSDSQGNESSSLSESQSKRESTVVQRDSGGGETPYVAESMAPEIAGVLVIAQGAGDASTASEITGAVMALFGVEAHKIKVMKMRSGG